MSGHEPEHAGVLADRAPRPWGRFLHASAGGIGTLLLPATTRLSHSGVVAAFVAAGIGCAVFGAMVVGAAASEDLARLLTVSEPVGPLSGKALAAVAAWLGSWVGLHVLLRRRDVSVAVGIRLTFALVGVALVETFPPFYELFMS